jgi:hypothetical protein
MGPAVSGYGYGLDATQTGRQDRRRPKGAPLSPACQTRVPFNRKPFLDPKQHQCNGFDHSGLDLFRVLGYQRDHVVGDSTSSTLAQDIIGDVSDAFSRCRGNDKSKAAAFDVGR